VRECSRLRGGLCGDEACGRDEEGLCRPHEVCRIDADRVHDEPKLCHGVSLARTVPRGMPSGTPCHMGYHTARACRMGYAGLLRTGMSRTTMLHGIPAGAAQVPKAHVTRTATNGRAAAGPHSGAVVHVAGCASTLQAAVPGGRCDAACCMRAQSRRASARARSAHRHLVRPPPPGRPASRASMASCAAVLHQPPPCNAVRSALLYHARRLPCAGTAAETAEARILDDRPHEQHVRWRSISVHPFACVRACARAWVRVAVRGDVGARKLVRLGMRACMRECLTGMRDDSQQQQQTCGRDGRVVCASVLHDKQVRTPSCTHA
jgi:hypothetical protein